MKLSRIGRVSMALVASVAMGLGMTACGGGTIGFMWVLGTQYNQLAGFKIDDFSGNLTQIPHSPFSTGGADPVSIVVKPGGRFLYVVNKGGSNNTGVNPACGTAGSISEFSIGGQGVLTFQQCFQSQGSTPVWAAHDSTGNFLYVLDQVAPTAVCDTTNPNFTATSCFGDITVFSIDPNTGRLTLVLNQQIKDPNTGLQLTYFQVGNTPTMMALSGGCLFTLNSADQTVFPYAAGGSGQLTQTTNSLITTGATRATSIITGGSAIYITDAGSNQILPFTVGTSSCSLNTITGGAIANISPASNPVYALVGGTGGSAANTHLYVANQSTTNSTLPNSSISAFNIQSNGQLQPLPDPGNNPYPVGAGPVCMVEDPSNQYIYTSNGDGTVTGKSISTVGQLSNLKRATTFTATGQATCLAVSGNVD